MFPDNSFPQWPPINSYYHIRQVCVLWVCKQLCDRCLCGSTCECWRTTSPLWWVTVVWSLSPQGPTSLLRKALDDGPWAAVGFNKVAGFILACVAYSLLKCSQHSLCLTYFPLCYCIFTEAIENSSKAWQAMCESIFVDFSFSVILRSLPNFMPLE